MRGIQLATYVRLRKWFWDGFPCGFPCGSCQCSLLLFNLIFFRSRETEARQPNIRSNFKGFSRVREIGWKMAPRKASKASNVAPQRSSPRLRRKKQQDPSYTEKKSSTVSVESLAAEEAAKRLASRPRRGKHADPTYVEEPSPAASIVPIEVERTTETAVELRSFSRERRLTKAEERELEVFDPAWSVTSSPTPTFAM